MVNNQTIRSLTIHNLSYLFIFPPLSEFYKTKNIKPHKIPSRIYTQNISTCTFALIRK